MARVYFHKRNLTQHIKSSHEGKKYECTYPDCGTRLCSQVSRIEVNRIIFSCSQNVFSRPPSTYMIFVCKVSGMTFDTHFSTCVVQSTLALINKLDLI